MMREVRPARQTAAAVFLISVALVAIVAVSAMRGQAALQPSQLSSQVGNAPATPAPSPSQLVTSVRIPGRVWAIAWDSSRSLLWFPYAPSPDENLLASYDPVTTALRTWRIPVTGYEGVTTQVAVGDDGAIWFDENYTIIRLDPTLSTVSSVSLPLQTEGMLSGALDETKPSAGTGISGILPDQSDLLVARYNVTNLTRVDSTLTNIGTVPLPAGIAGPTGLQRTTDGGYVIFSGRFSAGVLTVLTPDFHLKSSVAVNATGVVSNGEQFVASGGPETGVALSSAGSATAPAVVPNLGPNSWVVHDPRGGLTLYNDATGRLDRIEDGQIVGEYQLPPTHAIGMPPRPSIPGTSPGVSNQAMGTPPPRPADVYAMVDDSSGTTWCFVMATDTLFGVRL